jgi:hypothetical protein
MTVEIGTEAAQFPEKEYINGIAVAVYASSLLPNHNYNVLFPNSYTHISVRDLYISKIGLSRAIPRKGIRKWNFRCSAVRCWYFESYVENGIR